METIEITLSVTEILFYIIVHSFGIFAIAYFIINPIYDKTFGFFFRRKCEIINSLHDLWLLMSYYLKLLETKKTKKAFTTKEIKFIKKAIPFLKKELDYLGKQNFREKTINDVLYVDLKLFGVPQLQEYLDKKILEDVLLIVNNEYSNDTSLYYEDKLYVLNIFKEIENNIPTILKVLK